MSLLDFLGVSRSKRERKPASPLAAALEAQLRDHSADEVERVAAYAGLLVRVAHADVHISDAERSKLAEIIREHTGLTPEQSREVGDLAIREATELEGIEYALLTRAVNDFAQLEEKEKLIDCLYAVATADDCISMAEDDEIRAVARALLLSHTQFIRVRQRYNDKLEVLQALRRERSS